MDCGVGLALRSPRSFGVRVVSGREGVLFCGSLKKRIQPERDAPLVPTELREPVRRARVGGRGPRDSLPDRHAA